MARHSTDCAAGGPWATPFWVTQFCHSSPELQQAQASSDNMQASFRPVVSGKAFRPAVASRGALVCQSSALRSVPVPVKSVDGADKGTQELAVRVAEDSARGLVHRYMVMVQQNARRVSLMTSAWLDATPGPLIGGRNIAALANNDAAPSHHIALSNRDCIASRIISLQGTASCLTRSEVRGGGKKPYAQKGTGNARRGSSTSPLFAGGGVSFGPKVRDSCTSHAAPERKTWAVGPHRYWLTSFSLGSFLASTLLSSFTFAAGHSLMSSPIHPCVLSACKLGRMSLPPPARPSERTRLPPSPGFSPQDSHHHPPTHASICPRPGQRHSCLTRPPFPRLPPPSERSPRTGRSR